MESKDFMKVRSRLLLATFGKTGSRSLSNRSRLSSQSKISNGRNSRAMRYNRLRREGNFKIEASRILEENPSNFYHEFHSEAPYCMRGSSRSTNVKKTHNSSCLQPNQLLSPSNHTVPTMPSPLVLLLLILYPLIATLLVSCNKFNEPASIEEHQINPLIRVRRQMNQDPNSIYRQDYPAGIQHTLLGLDWAKRLTSTNAAKSVAATNPTSSMIVDHFKPQHVDHIPIPMHQRLSAPFQNMKRNFDGLALAGSQHNFMNFGQTKSSDNGLQRENNIQLANENRELRPILQTQPKQSSSSNTITGTTNDYGNKQNLMPIIENQLLQDQKRVSSDGSLSSRMSQLYAMLFPPTGNRGFGPMRQENYKNSNVLSSGQVRNWQFHPNTNPVASGQELQIVRTIADTGPLSEQRERSPHEKMGYTFDKRHQINLNPPYDTRGHLERNSSRDNNVVSSSLNSFKTEAIIADRALNSTVRRHRELAPDASFEMTPDRLKLLNESDFGHDETGDEASGEELSILQTSQRDFVAKRRPQVELQDDLSSMHDSSFNQSQQMNHPFAQEENKSINDGLLQNSDEESLVKGRQPESGDSSLFAEELIGNHTLENLSSIEMEPKSLQLEEVGVGRGSNQVHRNQLDDITNGLNGTDLRSQPVNFRGQQLAGADQFDFAMGQTNLSDLMQRDTTSGTQIGALATDESFLAAQLPSQYEAVIRMPPEGYYDDYFKPASLPLAQSTSSNNFFDSSGQSELPVDSGKSSGPNASSPLSSQFANDFYMKQHLVKQQELATDIRANITGSNDIFRQTTPPTEKAHQEKQQAHHSVGSSDDSIQVIMANTNSQARDPLSNEKLINYVSEDGTSGGRQPGSSPRHTFVDKDMNEPPSVDEFAGSSGPVKAARGSKAPSQQQMQGSPRPEEAKEVDREEDQQNETEMDHDAENENNVDTSKDGEPELRRLTSGQLSGSTDSDQFADRKSQGKHYQRPQSDQESRAHSRRTKHHQHHSNQHRRPSRAFQQTRQQVQSLRRPVTEVRYGPRDLVVNPATPEPSVTESTINSIKNLPSKVKKIHADQPDKHELMNELLSALDRVKVAIYKLQPLTAKMNQIYRKSVTSNTRDFVMDHHKGTYAKRYPPGDYDDTYDRMHPNEFLERQQVAGRASTSGFGLGRLATRKRRSQPAEGRGITAQESVARAVYLPAPKSILGQQNQEETQHRAVNISEVPSKKIETEQQDELDFYSLDPSESNMIVATGVGRRLGDGRIRGALSLAGGQQGQQLIFDDSPNTSGLLGSYQAGVPQPIGANNGSSAEQEAGGGWASNASLVIDSAAPSFVPQDQLLGLEPSPLFGYRITIMQSPSDGEDAESASSVNLFEGDGETEQAADERNFAYQVDGLDPIKTHSDDRKFANDDGDSMVTSESSIAEQQQATDAQGKGSVKIAGFELPKVVRKEAQRELDQGESRDSNEALDTKEAPKHEADFEASGSKNKNKIKKMTSKDQDEKQQSGKSQLKKAKGDEVSKKKKEYKKIKHNKSAVSKEKRTMHRDKHIKAHDRGAAKEKALKERTQIEFFEREQIVDDEYEKGKKSSVKAHWLSGHEAKRSNHKDGSETGGNDGHNSMLAAGSEMIRREDDLLKSASGLSQKESDKKSSAEASSVKKSEKFEKKKMEAKGKKFKGWREKGYKIITETEFIDRGSLHDSAYKKRDKGAAHHEKFKKHKSSSEGHHGSMHEQQAKSHKQEEKKLKVAEKKASRQNGEKEEEDSNKEKKDKTMLRKIDSDDKKMKGKKSSVEHELHEESALLASVVKAAGLNGSQQIKFPSQLTGNAVHKGGYVLPSGDMTMTRHSTQTVGRLASLGKPNSTISSSTVNASQPLQSLPFQARILAQLTRVNGSESNGRTNYKVAVSQASDELIKALSSNSSHISPSKSSSPQNNPSLKLAAALARQATSGTISSGGLQAPTIVVNLQRPLTVDRRMDEPANRSSSAVLSATKANPVGLGHQINHVDIVDNFTGRQINKTRIGTYEIADANQQHKRDNAKNQDEPSYLNSKDDVINQTHQITLNKKLDGPTSKGPPKMISGDKPISVTNIPQLVESTLRDLASNSIEFPLDNEILSRARDLMMSQEQQRHFERAKIPFIAENIMGLPSGASSAGQSLQTTHTVTNQPTEATTAGHSSWTYPTQEHQMSFLLNQIAPKQQADGARSIVGLKQAPFSIKTMFPSNQLHDEPFSVVPPGPGYMIGSVDPRYRSINEMLDMEGSLIHQQRALDQPRLSGFDQFIDHEINWSNSRQHH